MFRTVKKLSLILAAAALLLNLPLKAMAQEEASDSKNNNWKYWLGAGALVLEADDEGETAGLYEVRVSYDMNPAWTLEGGIGGVPFSEGNNHNAPDRQEATYQGVNSPGENWLVKSNFGALYHLDQSEDRVWDPYLSVVGGMGAWGKYRDGSQFMPFGGPGFGVGYNYSDDLRFRLDYNVVAAKQDNVDINHHILALVSYDWGRNGGTEGTGEGAGADEGAGAGLGAASSGPLKPIYFDYDKSNITSNSQKTLGENAQWMKSNPGKHVSLEGHCDERGTNEYNMALGARRSKSAQEYLRSLGIPASQMSTQSFGEEFPADPGHDESAWSKNRRVESVVK